MQTKFAQLEHSLDGRLGVFALDTSDGRELTYRADERFPMKSTFKVFVVSAILDRSSRDSELIKQHIQYAQSDLVKNSPIIEKYVGQSITVAELIDATMKYSDNTATNLLMKILGGPAVINTFAHSIGNHEAHIDSWASQQNEEPDDRRDTSTPKAMALSLQKLALGDVLKDPQRELLIEELMGNTIGATRIRAGLPIDWKVANKTGAGHLYGIRSDIAVLWPPSHAPIVLAIYTIRRAKDAEPRDDIIASATRIVVDWVQ